MDEEMMPKEKYPGQYSIYPGAAKYPGQYSIYPGAAKEWGRGAVPIG